MKRLICFLFLFFLMSNLSAQILRYYTKEVSLCNTQKGEWTEWKECPALVVINIDKNRITIYTKEIQEYDCYSSSEEVDKNNDNFIELMCVDKNGLNCIIFFYHEKRAIFITFPKLNLMAAYTLDEDYRTSE